MHDSQHRTVDSNPKRGSRARCGLVAVASAGTLLLMSGTAAAAPASHVVPPHGTVAGRGYGFYAGKSWQLTFESPHNRVRACATVTVSGHKVGMLQANVTGPGTYSQTCTEPAGRPLYLKHLSDECSTFKGDHAGYGTTGAQLKKCARAEFKGATGSTTVDGHRVSRINRFLAASGVYSINLNKSNFYGYKARHGRSAAYGYGVLLRGLSKGTHTVVVAGYLPSYKFRVKVTYTIKVT
jgi:hypothetical protein